MSYNLEEQVRNNTSAIQQIIDLARKAHQLPPFETDINGEDIFIIESNGVTYHVPARALSDFVYETNYNSDGVVQISPSTIITDPNNPSGKAVLTPNVPLHAIWSIRNVRYQKLSNTITAIPYAGNEKYRTDILVGTTSNTIVRISGVEDSFVGLPPTIPNNTVELTRVNVFGNQVGDPSLQPADGFITKASKQFRSVSLLQTEPKSLFLSHESTTYNVIWGANPLATKTLINFIISTGIDPTAVQLPYDGMDIYIRNSSLTGVPISLKHNHGSGIPFWFADGLDLVLKRHDIVHLKYNKKNNRVELVGVSSELTIPTWQQTIDATSEVLFATFPSGAEVTDEDGQFIVSRLGGGGLIIDSIGISLEKLIFIRDSLNLLGNQGQKLSKNVDFVQWSGGQQIQSSNFDILDTFHDAEIFVQGVTALFRPNTIAYRDGYSAIFTNTGVADAVVTFNISPDWTYEINGNAPVASGSISFKKMLYIRRVGAQKRLIISENLGVTNQQLLDVANTKQNVITPLVTSATAITLLLEHKDNNLTTTANTAITLTVPTMPTGTDFRFLTRGTGDITFVGSGVTIEAVAGLALKTDGKNSVVALSFTSPTTATLFGTLADL